MNNQVKRSNTHVVNHAIIADALAHLRNQYTALSTFRHFSDRICQVLFSEVVKNLELEVGETITPLEVSVKTQTIKEEIVLIPILRSGLAMLSPALRLLPEVKVGFIGLERNEETAIAKEYYWKCPKIREGDMVIITDPMLATGGSMLQLLDKITSKSPKEVRIVSVVTAPEGINLIGNKYPNVKIFTAAIDKCLNDVKYIVPGIGDYGDRYFGTTV